MLTKPTSIRDWILLTGRPGTGKTTAIKQITQALQTAGVPVQGFYTQEVRSAQGRSRIGFDVVTVPEGQIGPLARKAPFYSNQNYDVDVPSFERLAIPSLTIPVERGGAGNETNSPAAYPTVIILDEIARMELKSSKFKTAVQKLLDYDKRCLRLVGTVAMAPEGYIVPFCDHVTSQQGVRTIEITSETRDRVTQDVLSYIKSNWIEER